MTDSDYVEATGSASPLLVAVARHMVYQCAHCSGVGMVVIGIRSDRMIDGVKYAGDVIRGPCPSCGPIRDALKPKEVAR